MRRHVLLATLVAVAAASIKQSVPTPVNEIVEGFVTFFATSSCPDGWEPFLPSQGRLLVSVADAATAGVTVGVPLADQEDRQHEHAVATSVTLSQKAIAAIADDNHQAAMHGTYEIAGWTQGEASGYPFVQLPMCRYRGRHAQQSNATLPTASYGTVAYFSSDVESCPEGWVPKDDLTGRIAAAGYSEGGPASNLAPPLASGEDRAHAHTYEATMTTNDVSFAGIEGCCNDEPAATGEYFIAGNASASSTGLPYIQILTCVNQQPTFAASMPPGALLFQELQCPPGWTLVTTISGRLVVSLPDGAAPGATFGGNVLPSAAPVNPMHAHGVEGYVPLPPASVMLDSGCCGDGYAATGNYTFTGKSSSDSANLPYTMLPVCQQTTDKTRNEQFFLAASRC
jgi:hypothetical protein